MQLPIKLQTEAVSTAGYLSNVSHTKAIWNKTPHETWFRVKPKVYHLKVFGCLAYPLIPAQKLQKLDRKAVKGIFVGYCLDA